MARRKLAHFEEMKSMPHVFEFPENMAGKWSSHFDNNNPIVLEIGCGGGEYVLGLSLQEPNKNYIGVDIKGSRMWHGAKAIEARGTKNVVFLRTRVEQLGDYFEAGEISEIWVTFPDPHPREAKARKRLVSDRFLSLYAEVFGKEGKLFFKTDNLPLFEYGLEMVSADKHYKIVSETKNLYALSPLPVFSEIKTTFEKKFLAKGMQICFLEAMFNQ